MDRLQESELRRMGRTALQKAANAGAGKQSPGIARRPMLVTKVNSDGTLDLNMGSADNQKILPGIRMTSACYGVKVGDVVVVETIDHKSFATGIVAKTSKDPNDNGPYVKSQASTTKVVLGSKVVNFPANTDWAVMFTDSQYRSLVGRSFSQSYDVVTTMNGDDGANGTFMFYAAYRPSDKAIIIKARQYGTNDAHCNGLARVNYAIVAR